MYCKCGCKNITPVARRNRYNLGHIKGRHIDYLMGHKMRGVRGEKHFNYKGDRVGYKAFHLRVNQIRGKADICEDCKSDYFVEWANLTGRYEDIYDYKKLCRKCHNKFDDISNRSAITKKKIPNYLSFIAHKGWETRGFLSKGGGLRE